MMNIPSVGSKVSVTVRHKSIYLYANQPWDDRTYVGTVVKSAKWVDAESFTLQTEDSQFPIKIIHSGKVHNLKFLSGGASLNIRKFQVQGKGGTYTVTKTGKEYSCTCIGFKYHSKCKHITAVIDKE